jgi:hypothetical protein
MKYLAFKCRFETTQATNKKTGPDQQVVHIKRMYVYVQTSNTSLNQIALLMPTRALWQDTEATQLVGRHVQNPIKPQDMYWIAFANVHKLLVLVGVQHFMQVKGLAPCFV